MLRGVAVRSERSKLLQLRDVYRCLTNVSCSCARAPIVLASTAEQLTAAVPGTVKEYEHHILIQTAPLKSDTAAKDCHVLHGCWWPSVVEK